jgi:hypothetical protein
MVFDVRSNGSAAPRLAARLTYDGVLSTLEYDVSTDGVEAEDVLAVVLRDEDEEGRPYVAARVSGPGTARATGRLVLNGPMRGRLERGELWLELMTRTEPFGAARAQVALPGR